MLKLPSLMNALGTNVHMMFVPMYSSVSAAFRISRARNLPIVSGPCAFLCRKHHLRILLSAFRLSLDSGRPEENSLNVYPTLSSSQSILNSLSGDHVSFFSTKFEIIML